MGGQRPLLLLLLLLLHIGWQMLQRRRRARWPWRLVVRAGQLRRLWPRHARRSVLRRRRRG